jgi:hypothetical protein
VPGLDGPAIRSGSHSAATLAAVSDGASPELRSPNVTPIWHRLGFGHVRTLCVVLKMMPGRLLSAVIWVLAQVSRFAG